MSADVASEMGTPSLAHANDSNDCGRNEGNRNQGDLIGNDERFSRGAKDYHVMSEPLSSNIDYTFELAGGTTQIKNSLSRTNQRRTRSLPSLTSDERVLSNNSYPSEMCTPKSQIYSPCSVLNGRSKSCPKTKRRAFCFSNHNEGRYDCYGNSMGTEAIQRVNRLPLPKELFLCDLDEPAKLPKRRKIRRPMKLPDAIPVPFPTLDEFVFESRLEPSFVPTCSLKPRWNEITTVYTERRIGSNTTAIASATIPKAQTLP